MARAQGVGLIVKLKIFSCHHVLPERSLSTEIFQTLVSGREVPAGSGVATDMAGKNIGHLEKFCELRHQYYVWQNLLAEYDYVGFEHYRRPFYIDPLSPEAMDATYPLLADVRHRFAQNPAQSQIKVAPEVLDEYNRMRSAIGPEEEAAIRTWAAGQDLVFTMPIFEDPGLNFRRYHGSAEKLWSEFRARARAHWLGRFRGSFIDIPHIWSAYLNMYIMPSDFFDEYMDILFSVLLELDRKHPEAPARIWGHMSERLLGAFIIQKVRDRPLLRYGAVPFLFHDIRAQ